LPADACQFLQISRPAKRNRMLRLFPGQHDGGLLGGADALEKLAHGAVLIHRKSRSVNEKGASKDDTLGAGFVSGGVGSKGRIFLDNSKIWYWDASYRIEARDPGFRP
jgi:hypothetical protein